MKLSHLDAEGRARMVDVGDKPVSDRTAIASGAVLMSRKAYEVVAGEGVPKGDVLAVAQALVQGGELGQLLDAGGAPGGPEVHHHHLAHQLRGAQGPSLHVL